MDASAESRSQNRALTGRVVIVTGGNRGIGLGIGRAAGDAGAAVMIWARDTARSEAAVSELGEAGIEAAAVRCDVTDEVSVADAMKHTIGRFGRIDGLVANAGTQGNLNPLVDMTLDDWNEVIAVNLTGAMLTFRAAARQLIAQGGPGALVAVSSIISRYGGPHRSHYAVTKTGLHALVTSAAIELARHKIRCNSVAPGWTRTEIVDFGLDTADNDRFEQTIIARTPARRWGTPADSAAAVVMLLDPAHDFHTGDLVTVDGGYTTF